MMNINRRVEDDDLENAKKAADDHEEIVLGQISKAPATKLKLHLDLAPEDVDRERIAGQFTYPEWDARGGVWLPDHCRVLAAPVEPAADYSGITDDASRRRIRAVKRQFEALRPAKLIRHAQPDGEEMDLDATLRSVADLRATGRGSDRIWQQARPEKRDLAVSILLDVSRSTESAVTGRPVIDIVLANDNLAPLARNPNLPLVPPVLGASRNGYVPDLMRADLISDAQPTRHDPDRLAAAIARLLRDAGRRSGDSGA